MWDYRIFFKFVSNNDSEGLIKYLKSLGSSKPDIIELPFYYQRDNCYLTMILHSDQLIKTLILTNSDIKSDEHYLIHLCFIYSPMEIIKWLIDQKYNLTQPNDNGQYPIHLLFMNQQVKLIEYYCLHSGHPIKWDTQFHRIQSIVKTIVQTNSIAKLLVSRDGLFIQAVPLNLRTYKIYQLAWKTTPSPECARFIPADIMDDILLDNTGTCCKY
jgi:hypothetical protein